MRQGVVDGRLDGPVKAQYALSVFFYGAVLGVVPERIGMPVRKGALVLKMCQNSFDIGPMLSACLTDTARTHRPNPIGFFGQLQGACFPTAKYWRI